MRGGRAPLKVRTELINYSGGRVLLWTGDPVVAAIVSMRNLHIIII